MTQEQWNRMSATERAAVVDKSALHARLIGLEGKRVRVHPKREYGASTFRVGKSTGWRPCHLAMRGNARGSSDVIGADEVFSHVELLR